MLALAARLPIYFPLGLRNKVSVDAGLTGDMYLEVLRSFNPTIKDVNVALMRVLGQLLEFIVS